MAAEKIGDARCPVCKSGGARVSLSRSNLAVLTCNSCNCQVFTRSGRSDELVRGLIAPTPAPAPVPAPPPAPEPAPAPQPPAPAPARKGFGLFGNLMS